MTMKGFIILFIIIAAIVKRISDSSYAFLGYIIIFIIIIAMVALESFLKNAAAERRKKIKNCPCCGSRRFYPIVEEEIISYGKVKTTYSLNLNPFRPFTLFNKKEKVVKKPQTRLVSRFVCDDCGNIF